MSKLKEIRERAIADGLEEVANRRSGRSEEMKTSLRKQFLQAIENRKAKMEKEVPKPEVKEETKKPTRRGRRKKILDDDDD